MASIEQVRAASDEVCDALTPSKFALLSSLAAEYYMKLPNRIKCHGIMPP
jgi:hypothetical protein